MKTQRIIESLDELYPDAHCELQHRNEFEMAIAVVLSAQTTDASVNRVTPVLFAKYPDAQALAAAPLEDIEDCIRALGLYRNKARSIKGLAEGVTQRYNGEIPRTMKELLTLPGVGRKCANVILAECFGVPALAVDTHVSRVSKRLGLAKPGDDVTVIEKKLKRRIPQERWIKTHHQFIFFGRYLCHARNPECERCPLKDLCREYNKNQEK